MQEKIKKIGIVADEGGDLPEKLIKDHQISVVPFRVDLGEMKNIAGNIYQKIREAEKRGIKSFIKTSQPSLGDFLKAFKEKLKHFEQIICVTVTSKHSGTFNCAFQAREFLPEKEKIHVIDSSNVSGGEGLIILKIAELVERGFEIKQILEKAKQIISNTHLIFMLQNPKWAENSGRIPKVLGAFLRKMQNLGFHPVLGIKKGKVSFLGIKKGFKSMAESLFDEFKKRVSKEKKVEVAITHADNLPEAKKLESLIFSLKNCKIKFSNIIGNIVGGLSGPGALVLSWQHD